MIDTAEVVCACFGKCDVLAKTLRLVYIEYIPVFNIAHFVNSIFSNVVNRLTTIVGKVIGYYSIHLLINIYVTFHFLKLYAFYVVAGVTSARFCYAFNHSAHLNYGCFVSLCKYSSVAQVPTKA
jgi:hypothetical protein